MDFSKCLLAFIASALMIFSVSVSAQMRPECGADPSKPGACFFTSQVGGAQFFCEDGIIAIGPAADAKRDIGRINPKGTIAVHQTAAMLPAGACRTQDFSICGTVQDPGPGVFIGQANLHANGFITPEGLADCPFKATVNGTFFRDMGLGLEEAEIDAVLQFVKDKENPFGCRLQKCRIFASEEDI